MVPRKSSTTAARKGRKRLSSAERRVQIADSARGVFLRSGRDGVSTHQVAEAAGVNVALVYQHFRSSAHLFDVSILETLESFLQERVQSAEEELSIVTDARDKLIALHRLMLEMVVEAGPMLGMALFTDQDSGRAFYRDQVQPLLLAFLERSVASLPGWTGQPASAPDVARTILGIDLTFSLHANLGGEDIDIPRLAEELADFMMLGFKEPGPQAVGRR